MALWEGHRVDRLEWALERLEDAIELHAHLKCERPPGVIVRRRWRSPGRRNVVGVVLRLEHVEHVWSKRLRGLHDERARRVALVASLERGGRAMDRHSRLEQRFDELRRCEEVGLIGWQDVGACVSMGRVTELALEVAASASSGQRTWRNRPGVAVPSIDGVLPH